MMRKQILYYAIKYDGNYDKIHKAIERNESIQETTYTGDYVTILDLEYPDKLLELNKPPYILFYKGDITLLKQSAIGIVGSRDAKSYAISMTKKFVSTLQNNIIVSGMAKGIDTVAHQSALLFKHRTIAVLGSGINYIYPYENKNLYHYLAKHELVISEYPNNVKPKPYYFPFRNRIIAALSDELYVMQASLRSGTLLTVNDALELNRDIYVLPYRINDKEGKGCNMLIQQGANIIMDEEA